MSESSVKLQHFFSDLVESCKDSEGIVITTHSNADVDGLASAAAMYALLSIKIPSIKHKCSLVLPTINKLALKVVKAIEFNKEIIQKEWPENIETVIVVDTPDLELTDFPIDQLPNRDFWNLRGLFFFDHHKVENIQVKSRDINTSAIKTFLDPNYPSACEIVVNLFRLSLGAPLSDFDKDYLNLQKVSSLLLLGILTDTGNLNYADNTTFDYVSFLLNSFPDIKIQDLKKHLITEKSRSERIARLRAAMRVKKLYYIEDWIVAFTHLSSFGASAANGLIKLGASVSFVVSFNKKQKNKFHISSRASKSILIKTPLNLSLLNESIGKRFNGGGGGHKGAAGSYGYTKDDGDLNELIRFTLEQLRSMLQ